MNEVMLEGAGYYKDPPIVLERAFTGNCPICDKPLFKQQGKIQEYSGQTVFICKEHEVR